MKDYGFYGLIPIFMGLAILFGFEEDEEGKLNSLVSHLGNSGLLISTAIITAAMGGDDVAVYVPFFLTFSVADFLSRYELYIVPAIFIPLGIYIMYSYGVFG